MKEHKDKGANKRKEPHPNQDEPRRTPGSAEGKRETIDRALHNKDARQKTP